MALWRGDVLAMAESRELHGFRVVTLRSQVRQNAGVIDVFRPACEGTVASRAADWMFRQAGENYGYESLAKDVSQHFLLVRYFLKLIGRAPRPATDREPGFWDHKYCSEAVCWSYRRAVREYELAGSWDPCPRLASQYVEPNDLAHSDAFSLQFTGLVPELRIAPADAGDDEKPLVVPFGQNYQPLGSDV